MKSPNQNICHAYWETGESGLILLANDWAPDAKLPPLFLGPDRRPFGSLERAPLSDCGRLTRYYKEGRYWYFVLHAKRYTQFKDKRVKVYLGGDFNEWEKAIGKPEWELKPDTDELDAVYQLRIPAGKIPVDGSHRFKFVTEDGEWLDAPDSAPNWVHEADGVGNFEFDPGQSGRHVFHFTVPKGYVPVGNEEVVWKDGGPEERVPLPSTQFLTSAGTQLPLGAIVEEGRRTVFRLFAPRARAVKVVYGRKVDGSDATVAAMEHADSVTWEVVVPENLHGWYYSYRLEGENPSGTSHFDGNFPVLDPYALACVGNRGPGIVIDQARLPKVDKPFTPPAWHDLVIMEGHVRDLAAHAPIPLSAEERRGYTGLRKWLQAEGSYLREMGINAVELQPIQEFDNPTVEDYHWGYMTVNYFSPEGSYALEPEKASQIGEFKALVDAFHEAGIAVLVDVVYNHVGEPNHLLFIDKCYYFHLDQANDLVNWSGCGNDLRCDTPMARRLIIESLKHLVLTYDIDGFRFDLAELIGIEVLREVERELKAVKPSIVLIAEPWSFRGHIQDELRETGFASWNDGYREFIAKYVCGEGNQDGIRYFLSGSPSTSRFAAQTINYTESHDDHCWLDRITERPGHDGSNASILDRRRTHLMAAVLFASVGVPMIAAGQDFLRSKHGISNTYQRGDINALDYNKRYVYSGTHGYFRDWIRFRTSDAGALLRVDGALPEGYLKFFHAEGHSAVAVLYNADGSRGPLQLLFAVNPHFEYVVIPPDGLASRKLRQVADHERFQLEGIDLAKFPIDSLGIHLPPISCGLWMVEE